GGGASPACRVYAIPAPIQLGSCSGSTRAARRTHLEQRLELKRTGQRLQRRKAEGQRRRAISREGEGTGEGKGAGESSHHDSVLRWQLLEARERRDGGAAMGSELGNNGGSRAG